MKAKQIIWILAGIVGIWGGYGIIVLLAPLAGWEVKGQFGDTFGAVNALFAGLAFGGIVITILLQREELQQQKDLMKKQIFEPLYLDLMGDIWDVQESIALEAGFSKGKKAFSYLMKKTGDEEKFRNIVNNRNLSSRQAIANELLRRSELDPEIVRNESSAFLHPTRIALMVLDTQHFSIEEKRHYAFWLKGYFSQEELYAIALLADNETQVLIEKYGILEKMNDLQRRILKQLGWNSAAFE